MPLEDLGLLGEGLLPFVVRSPDGKLIFVNDGKKVRWLDANSYDEMGSMLLDGGGYQLGMVFSPSGKFIWLYSVLGAEVIDWQQKKDLVHVGGGNGVATQPAFTADDKYLIYRATDRSTGGPYEYIGRVDLTHPEGAFFAFPMLHEDLYHFVSGPAVSPDGKLAAAGYQGAGKTLLYIWDLRTGQVKYALANHASQINSVDFSPDGRYLASGSDDATVRLWDPHTGRQLKVITGFQDSVQSVRFSEDSKTIDIEVTDQTAQNYDLQTGQLTPYEEPPPQMDPYALILESRGYLDSHWGVYNTVFSPDGKLLALSDRNVLVWDVASRELKTSLQTPGSDEILGLVFSPDSNRLAANTSSGGIAIWDVKSGELIRFLTPGMLSEAQEPVGTGQIDIGVGIGAGIVGDRGLTFSPDSGRVLFGNGLEVDVWDIVSGRKLFALEQGPQPGYPDRVSFSADGERIYAVFNRNRAAGIWNAKDGKLIRWIDLPRVNPNAFTVTDLNGSLFARNNFDDGGYWIELWNLETNEMTKLTMPSRETEPLRFSPDGSLLMTINQGRLFIWRTDPPALVFLSNGIFNQPAIALSPDNSLLATGEDGKAHLWGIKQIAEQALLPELTPLSPPPSETPWIDTSWPTETPYPTRVLTPIPVPELTGNPIEPDTAARLTRIGNLGNGTIEQVNWSSEGESLVVAGSKGVFEYDSDSLDEQRSSQPGFWMYDAVLSPQDHLLAVGTIDNRIVAWDDSSTKVLANVDGLGHPAISPDGQLMAYLDGQGDIRVQNLSMNEIALTLKSDIYPYPGIQSWMMFSPDNKLLAAMQLDSSVRIWDLQDGTIVNGLGGPSNVISDFSFSADNKFVIGAAGGSAWVWDLRPTVPAVQLEIYPDELKGNLTLSDNQVTAVALSPDHRQAAIGTTEHTLLFYDWANKRKSKQLDSLGILTHLRYSPDGKRLLGTTRDGQIIIWDTTTYQPVQRAQDHLGPVDGLVAQTGGTFAGWTDNTALVINPMDASIRQKTYIPSGRILSASPRGDWLAIYSPYKVSLWDAQSGQFFKELEGEVIDPFVEYYWEGQVTRQFYGAPFSPDGSRLATLGTGGVWLFDAKDGSLIRKLDANYARTATISPDNQWIAYSVYDLANNFWVTDIKTGEMLYSIGEGVAVDYPQITFSPDNLWIGAINNGSRWDEEKIAKLELWSTSTRALAKELPFTVGDSLAGFAFSPDAKLIAVGHKNGQISIIDVQTLEILATLDGHNGSVSRLAFSSDGSYLASGGDDGTIILWGVPGP